MYCISTSKVANAWEDVIDKCMNGDMNRIWPKHVYNLEGFSAVIPAVGGDVWLSELEQNTVHVYFLFMLCYFFLLCCCYIHISKKR